jgi:hypothetical protein
MTPSKIHVGLISADKAWENSLKEALAQTGGGYVHHGRSMLELYQKMSMQKVQLIVLVMPPGEGGAEAQAVVQFFRGKRDYTQIPICVLTESPQVTMKHLLRDSRVRGFSTLSGAFLALAAMQPLVHQTAQQEFVDPISLPWIESEFLQSLQAKVGEQTIFTVRPANDDDLHSSFFCQHSDEVRSHLGWFKFAARLQDNGQDGMRILFQGMSQEAMEETAQMLLNTIVTDFKSKAEADLQTRGAIFYPPIEDMAPADRKSVYSGSRSSGLLFESNACHVLLEVIQYI